MKAFKYLWDRPWLFLLFCLTFPFALVGLTVILQIVAYLCADAWVGIFHLLQCFHEWLFNCIKTFTEST